MLEKSSRSGPMPNDVLPKKGRPGVTANVGPGGDLLRRLPATAASCGDARAAMREFCRRRSLPDLSDDAELLTSELVSNAVRHASSAVTVSASVDERGLLVVVSDDGNEEAAVRATLPVHDAESGRGVWVVSVIAGAWGSSTSKAGTTAWFRLDAAGAL